MIYILRRLNGLSSFKAVSPIKVHYSNVQNGDSVESDFYKANHLPGSRVGLGLPWNDLLGKICFKGSAEELDEIVKALKLKYEDGNDKGKLIEKANVYDINDPFFSHTYFDNKFECIEGEILLDDDIPEQKLLVRSLKDRTDVIDRTEDTYHSTGAVWELISPAREEVATSETNDTKMKAYTMLSEKSKDSIEMIALILDVDYDNTIPDAAKNKIFESIEKNKLAKKLGGKFTDKFIELAAKSKDELIPIYNVRKAETNGLLSFNGSYYQFKAANSKAETNITVRTIPELVIYFDKNPEQLKILIAENEDR